MPLFDSMLTRRRSRQHFSTLPDYMARRLALACRELTEAEERMAEQLGLSQPPRLLMVDEEAAVILPPGDRLEMLVDTAKRAGSAEDQRA